MKVTVVYDPRVECENPLFAVTTEDITLSFMSRMGYSELSWNSVPYTCKDPQNYDKNWIDVYVAFMVVDEYGYIDWEPLGVFDSEELAKENCPDSHIYREKLSTFGRSDS